MRVFSNDCSFSYSWEEVSTANWRKYCPWNDKSTHVIAVDTLSRHVDPDSGILRTERLITVKQSAPKWLSSLMGGSDTSHVFEISYVDPAAKKVTMTSSNMTFSNIITCHETVVYKPLSDNKTQFLQEAKITAVCGGWQKIKNAVEEASVARFSENARTGREGFESVLEMSRRVFQNEKKEKERQKAIEREQMPQVEQKLMA
ncbi:PRELI-like family-domain-containing protein [Calycina marina]|uniref:PRELI-like family-domain-containing protein n=1 Tax=Calycina marina TaxID=1763456 RepID=A0A9P8CDG8_9HELO|nr:PRELI-like family-domain-containing protein [Calycina marina]